MGLIFALEQDDVAKRERMKSPMCHFIPHRRNVALACNAAADQPSEESINDALLSNKVPDHPTFLVTPYDFCIENTDEGSPVLEKFYSNISISVGKRENVTIVSRGTQGDRYFEKLLLNLLDNIKITVEYAMQLVTDEIAKEKQMQRLLQLEGDGRSGVKESTKGTSEYSRSRTDVGKALPISTDLIKTLHSFNRKYPYNQKHLTHSRKSKNTDSSMSRYTLVSASHTSDLTPPCTKGTLLLPAAFVANPPVFHFTSHSCSVVGSRDPNVRKHSYLYSQQNRKSMLLLLGKLQTKSQNSPPEPLKGNGWGTSMVTYYFDGENSVMALPGIPNFKEVIRSFSVDFWIRTDCTASEGKRVLVQIMDGQNEDKGQLFQISLNCYEEMKESIRLFARDSANRVLEALISLNNFPQVTSGTSFHHILFTVQSLDEGLIQCLIDGRSADVQMVQQEHPIAFNSWPHRLFIGGFLNENNNPTSIFRGTLLDLRFWSDGEARKLLLFWRLFADASGKLIELTKTIPADHHESLLSLKQVEEPVPNSSPYFDGNLSMNLGLMPLWGELMQNWRLEISFRTDVSTSIMSLVGVTDQKYKMQEFGIVLNAEPLFLKERFHFHEFNVTFYLVDAFGACCSALLRGSERQNLMDGEWHTLVWKCVDSESNKFLVSVDGVPQELLYIVREGPNRFVEFDNWICVGGHNVRNWKVKRPFLGQIGCFYVSLRGKIYSTLNMDEGPGAYVMQDRSGHHNHGLLINPSTGCVRRNDVLWMPGKVKKCEEEREDNRKLDLVVYKNNHVSIAVVVFTCVFDSIGTPQEAIEDTIHGKTYSPQVISDDDDVGGNCSTKNSWRTWRAIPNECFKPLDTIVQLEESFNAVLSSPTVQGHLMIVVRIGDCNVTLLHLCDPELPLDAVYDYNMLKWRYSYIVEGQRGRRELMLNRMIESVESVLLATTMTPYTTARLGPLNSIPGVPLLSDDIVQSLVGKGKPWFLASILHAQLLNFKYGSSLHILHRVRPSMTFDEAASIFLFSKRLHDGAREKSAIVIQRNWRIKLAKADAFNRKQIREIQERKLEEIRVLRTNPLVQAKKELYALLITLNHVACPAVPLITAETADLEEVLRKQGYEVEHLADPTATQLMEAISHIDPSNSNFIYISGYGGQMNVRQPLLVGLHSLHITLEEGTSRATIGGEEGEAFRLLISQAKEARANIKPRRKGKKEKAVKVGRYKKANSEELEMIAQQQAIMFQTAQADLEQEFLSFRNALLTECEMEFQMIVRLVRQAVVMTQEYERKFMLLDTIQSYVYPCESILIEPYANSAINVETILRAALRQSFVPGFQCILAIDLEPVLPYSCGFACLASSTGNILRMPYKPQQRRILSWSLVKAFDGHAPRVPAASIYSVLAGGIDTNESQRDWKSFAKYIVGKMQSTCSAEKFNALCHELSREVPFVAELIPVRDVLMTDKVKDRVRRERDSQLVTAQLTFGVGSTKVQGDMFSLFKHILDNVAISEITLTNTIHLILSNMSRNIDGVLISDVASKIEECRPLESDGLEFIVRKTRHGIEVRFVLQNPKQRVVLNAWLSNITVRSLKWQISLNPLYGYSKLDVSYVEYLYTLKTTCYQRCFRKLLKQSYTDPLPGHLVRFLSVELVKTK
ncbi:unnamed protein product [Phytomonas sp. EM1]|nr:unnamed protein product [Phytomonas sp. EM1]|eukprot:CCW64620.1 unnamed protein product [Phytomonas sp. isolate EM1]